jgi:hypothetical protein
LLIHNEILSKEFISIIKNSYDFQFSLTDGKLAKISGDFLDDGAVLSDGYPKIMGATTEKSSEILSSVFTSGIFKTGRALPITHVPKSIAQAASIRFSAASQQSAM